MAVDAFPAHEDSGAVDGTTEDGDNGDWAVAATVDNLCIGNAYLPSNGTQGAYTTFRFMLGPFGSIHEWSILMRAGPNHGIATISLASIPEDDPASGFADDTGILQDISTLNFVPFVSTVNAYAVALTRNVHSFFPGSPLRVMGQPGDPFTAITFDAFSGLYFIDGGPGPYALKISMDTKGGAATSYVFDLQNLHRKRLDWAFG